MLWRDRRTSLALDGFAQINPVHDFPPAAAGGIFLFFDGRAHWKGLFLRRKVASPATLARADYPRWLSSRPSQGPSTGSTARRISRSFRSKPDQCSQADPTTSRQLEFLAPVRQFE